MISIKSTLIFAPETFNLAETTRSIEVAKKCSGNFNCIFIGYSKKYSYLIDQSNFLFIHLEPNLNEVEIDQIMKVDQLKGIRTPFNYQHLKKRIENEKNIIKKYEPVAIVIGTTLSMFISSRASKTPLIYVKPLAYTRTFFLKGHFDLPQSLKKPFLPQDFIKKLIKKVALTITYKPKAFTRLAKEESVSLPKYTIDALDADFNLITTMPEISKIFDLPEHYKYIGPVYAKLDLKVPAFLKSLPRKNPIIYFAMGSSGNSKVLTDFIRIFEELEVTIICPMKKMLETENLSFKHNIIICDYLPAHKIGEYIDLSIIHGGEGTVQTACLSGKPFLGFGLQQEQQINIEQCVRFGNAIALKKRDLTQDKMNNLINVARSSPKMLKKASEMRKLLKDIDGPANAAKFIIKRFSKN
ncbi:glycosyltransferase [Alkalicoccobacillus porphyridii]|uniref:Glycosyl transferase n=1 Tax=Alkalicoccobacillus porphyridii TaxID=2597270 RepID=A0A553ZXP2_9BACI|nr:nucleotide disphospho-sugar-binding domain-containing protein [Alkalicoccobacillus porphyridii]TSB46212.1 glycosyl transferase [Alkalicoccobacillus porphyridii]